MEYEINPKKKSGLGIAELWEYRELFYFFTWRDLKVKYKQTVLGFLWAILQPLFMTIVFTFFLGDSIVSKTNLTIPYPVFTLSGMLLWGIFSSGISNSANSMVANANIIKKIYFPRLIIPISSVLVALIDFFAALVVFIIFIFIYNIDINPTKILLLPLGILLTCISAIGCGTFLAALNIKYRDVRYVVPFFVQGLLFLTPVMYPLKIASNEYLIWVLRLNRMAGGLELIRELFDSYQVD